MLQHILLAIFVIGNVLTEWRNRQALPWWDNPISAYLAGVPWAWVQDVGFLALVAALGLLAAESSVPSRLLFSAGAAALLMVVLTKYILRLAKFHDASAAVAFTAVTAGILVRAWWTNEVAKWAGLAVISTAFLFMRFAPKKTSLEEKTVTGCILVALWALSHL